MTEAQNELHQLVARACADMARKHDMTADELSDYFSQALQGIKTMRAFKCSGECLAQNIEVELSC